MVVNFANDQRTDIKSTVGGPRRSLYKGALSRRTIAQIHHAARKLARRQEQAGFITFDSAIQVVRTTDIANDQFLGSTFAIVKIGCSIQDKVTLCRNRTGLDREFFLTDLGFKNPAGHVDIGAACIVKFNPSIGTRTGRHDFVQADIRSREPFIVAHTRITVHNLACTPGGCLSSVAALVHKRTALAVGKRRPRRFHTVRATHVAFTRQFHVNHVAFVRKLGHSTRLRVNIPRAIETAIECGISLHEQILVVSHDNVFALLEFFVRERIRKSSVQTHARSKHTADIRTTLDCHFDPFQCGTIVSIIHDFGNRHLGDRRIVNFSSRRQLRLRIIAINTARRTRHRSIASRRSRVRIRTTF